MVGWMRTITMAGTKYAVKLGSPMSGLGESLRPYQIEEVRRSREAQRETHCHSSFAFPGLVLLGLSGNRRHARPSPLSTLRS